MEQAAEDLKTHLAIVKQSPSDKIDEDFYNFMIKAKDQLGENSYSMAQFYFEYANFILEKVENNLQIFNEEALPNNPHHSEDDLVEDIPEEFDESDDPEVENNQNEEKEALPNDQPQIIEGDGSHQSAGAEEEDTNDKEIVIINFEMAKRIYEDQLQKIRNGQSSSNVEEVMDGIRRCLLRMADLYSIDEDYDKAIEYFQKTIDFESQRDGFESSRLVASVYFQKATCYNNQNGANCEIAAINQFLQAFNILLSHLSINLGYDIVNFDLPSQEKPKVDRFCYMCLAGDSEQVKQLKQLLSSILDKIEDTHSQIAINEAYLKEKQRIQEEDKESVFKPVEDPSKVVHLGSFGNRKKKLEEPLPELKVKEASPKNQQTNKEEA